MSAGVFQQKAGVAGFLFWAVLAAAFAEVGFAQGKNLPGTENAPVVGAKAPAFSLEGFDLQKEAGKGPIILVFYRGYF
jgi:hypothetical protein